MVLANDAELYVIGGESTDFFSDLYKYDIDGDEWTALEPCPIKVAFGSAFFVNLEFKGPSIFVVGGETNAGINNDIHIYSLDNDEWFTSETITADCTAAEVAAGEEPSIVPDDHGVFAAHYMGSAVTKSGRLLNFGGTYEGALKPSQAVIAMKTKDCPTYVPAPIDNSGLRAVRVNTATLLIVFGASGVTLLCAIWVVNILRRYMRRKFVAASENSTRKVVQSIFLNAFDVAVDIFQFQSNLIACEAQKLWVALAFGAGFLASVVEIGISLYYLFHNLSIGRVYIHDDMSEFYDAKCEKLAQENMAKMTPIAEKLRGTIRKSVIMYARFSKETSRRVKEISSRETKIVPVLSLSAAPKKSYAFGSDEELVELVKQRMKYEDEMASSRRGVYMAYGGILTALFEDLPQIIVNSYRVVTGCGNEDAKTCGSTLSDDNYTWTKADSWMFFYSIKTVLSE